MKAVSDFSFNEQFIPNAIQHLANTLSNFIDPNKIQKTSYPWEIISLISELKISNNFKSNRQNSQNYSLIFIGDIYVEENVRLPPIGFIQGPVYIGRNADLQTFSTVIGPTFIGENARVGPYSSIRSSIISPDVIIGQYVEINRSVLLNGTEIPHKNIIGDSFIGQNCWLAGEVTIANLRMDKKEVKAFIGKKRYKAGVKYGATIEDEVKIPAHVKILPGSYISRSMKIGFRDTVHGIKILSCWESL